VPSLEGGGEFGRFIWEGCSFSLSENHGGYGAFMKVQIDRNDCTSCASCWGLCPDLFEENHEDHFSQITEPNRAGSEAEGTVPEDLEGCAVESADACPVQIIHIE
jgi:ferredoxin